MTVAPFPSTSTDAALLADFIATGSDAAFGALVERHLPLVHSAARRQVGDTPLADDVTQAVFILLARKARSISRPNLLAGWLVTAAHFASRDARKAAMRRQFHERKAAEMRPIATTDVYADPTAALLPELDSALSRLRDAERAAIVMRYLEGRAMNEVAVAAGISEAAAAKRVERALIKLRKTFERRGVAMTSAGLGTVLATVGNSSAAALSIDPAAVSVAALSAARGVLSGATVSLSIAKGANLMMNLYKLKGLVVAWPVLLLAGVGGALIVHQAFSGSPHKTGTAVVIPTLDALPDKAPDPSAGKMTETAKPPIAPSTTPPETKPQPTAPPTAPPPTIAPKPADPSVAGMNGVGGLVKLAGKLPEARKLDMTAMPQCAGQHKEPAFEESIVANKDGGLANVVVSIKKQEGSDLPGEASKEPAVLDQKGCQYFPHVVAVMAGQPIVVKNSDPFLHNVHTLGEKNPSENKAMPTIDQNGGKLKIPTDSEYFRVKCDVHPWMGAWVAVLDNPYFAITDKDGKFTLPKGLPDGDYTLHAWHEKLGEQDGKLTVKDGRGIVEFIYQAQ